MVINSTWCHTLINKNNTTQKWQLREMNADMMEKYFKLINSDIVSNKILLEHSLITDGFTYRPNIVFFLS